MAAENQSCWQAQPVSGLQQLWFPVAIWGGQWNFWNFVVAAEQCNQARSEFPCEVQSNIFGIKWEPRTRIVGKLSQLVPSTTLVAGGHLRVRLNYWNFYVLLSQGSWDGSDLNQTVWSGIFTPKWELRTWVVRAGNLRQFCVWCFAQQAKESIYEWNIISLSIYSAFEWTKLNINALLQYSMLYRHLLLQEWLADSGIIKESLIVVIIARNSS